MSWFSDLAGRAESLLTNLDEQTGAAIRNHNPVKANKYDKNNIITADRVPWRKAQKGGSRSPARRSQNVNESKFTSPSKSITPPLRYSTNNSKPFEIRDMPSKLKRQPLKVDVFNNLNQKRGDQAVNEEELILQRIGVKQRRFSLPADLEHLFDNKFLSHRLENLVVENEMLKNELTVMNKEVSELLDRLRETEDDLDKAHKRVECSDTLNNNLNAEKCALNTELQQLKGKLDDLINVELTKLKEHNEFLEIDMQKLKDTNKDLENKVNQTEVHYKTTNTKLETDLRHAQTYVNDLQNDLERSKDECHRLEKDWEAYKLRVKSMLNSKDKEIKAIQDGVVHNNDNNALLAQIDSLRQERDDLTDVLDKAQNECRDLHNHMEQLETKRISAERLVTVLREALKEEREAKNKADAECLLIKKELKRFQTETSQTINNLQTQLNEKDTIINNMRELSSTNIAIDNSALNVADYDVMTASIANDKIEYLTETLVERQGKVDSLLAERNMLRIQLDKLESKYKNELSLRTSNHSIVNVNDVDVRSRGRNKFIPESVFNRISLRIGVFMKRNPFFRLLIIIYMVGLHFWVALVLLTYTPEVHPIDAS